MNIEEIKVGNSVYHKSRGRFVQIYGIEPSWEEVWLNFANGTAIYKAPIDFIEPIPLTKERLLLLGFEKCSKWYESEKGDGVYYNNGIYIKIDNNGFIQVEPVNFFYVEIGKRLNFVHQLQNRYSFFNEEELTFNA